MLPFLSHPEVHTFPFSGEKRCRLFQSHTSSFSRPTKVSHLKKQDTLVLWRDNGCGGAFLRSCTAI